MNQSLVNDKPWQDSHSHQGQPWSCPVSGKNEDVGIGVKKLRADYSEMLKLGCYGSMVGNLGLELLARMWKL